MQNNNDDLTMATPMPRVGYAYVPMQMLKETYSPNEALSRGTIFPELDLPMEKYGKQYEEQEDA